MDHSILRRLDWLPLLVYYRWTHSWHIYTPSRSEKGASVASESAHAFHGLSKESVYCSVCGCHAGVHGSQPILSADAEARRLAEQELGNLLAIIHRDGGHHTEAVGFRQSVADAHQVWAELQKAADASAAALTAAREAEREKARPLREALQKAHEWAAGYPLGKRMDEIAASEVWNACEKALREPAE